MPLNEFASIALAQTYFRQSQFTAAESELDSVLKETPDNVPAATMLAALYFRTGRLPQAESLLASLLRDHPDDPEILGLSGVLSQTRGDFSAGIWHFQRLVSLGHENANAYNQIGTCWLRLDDPIAAGQAFKRAIELDRSAAHSYYNLGLALKLAGNSFETFATFRRAIELDPEFLDSYVQLWQQMRQLLNWTDGLPLLESGLSRHPNSAQMRVILASTYGKVGQPDRAEKLFRQAVAMDSTAGPPYAHWLQEEGRFEESIPVLMDSVRESPVQGQAYYNLAIAKCFEVSGKSLAEVSLSLLNQKSIGPEGQMFLQYAIAKSYDQERNWEMAMRHYDAANELAYRLYNARFHFDAAAVEAEHLTLAGLYSPEAMERLRAHGSKSERPVFIVGMIRTGTTLLDQMLASHPQVASAGEQPFWQVSAGRINRRWLDSGGDVSDIKELEARYLAVLGRAGEDAARVTDKMPTNFTHMGLMSVVFPHGKFIHMRRNPLDTCLSIYTTFLGSGTQFAYSQENIVSYYLAYRRTMEFWLSVIPRDQIIEVDYEDLVTNKEVVLREILEFCGLEWDDACLSHERNTSQVSTPSLWTARQPVNSASVERWRRYEPWLGSLRKLEGLASSADA